MSVRKLCVYLDSHVLSKETAGSECKHDFQKSIVQDKVLSLQRGKHAHTGEGVDKHKNKT